LRFPQLIDRPLTSRFDFRVVAKAIEMQQHPDKAITKSGANWHGLHRNNLCPARCACPCRSTYSGGPSGSITCRFAVSRTGVVLGIGRHSPPAALCQWPVMLPAAGGMGGAGQGSAFFSFIGFFFQTKAAVDAIP